MQKPYPLLISIPHGGEMIPPEAEIKLRLGMEDLLEDSDVFTKTIFDPGGLARSVVSADIMRAIVDLNRAPGDLPPGNRDGVIKSHTSYNKKIYRNDPWMDASFVHNLLDKYYYRYHDRLTSELGKGEIEIAFDCHSMASTGPDIAPDPGCPRPAVNLGDNFGKACDREKTKLLADSFLEVFGLDRSDVSINKPFAGGYITRLYGNRPVPWIQIELNRGLYLQGGKPVVGATGGKLKELNRMFLAVVDHFFNNLAP